MGRRKIVIKQSVADSIAEVAWFIESKGMIATADRFIDEVYNFFTSLSDKRKSYADCKEPKRAAQGYKCISYKKKYTPVFIESDEELIIGEFISSKLIYW